MSKSARIGALGEPLQELKSSVIRVEKRSRLQKFVRMLAIKEAGFVFVTALFAKLLYIDWYLGPHQTLYPYLVPAPLLAFALHISFKQLGLYEVETLSSPVVGFGKVLGGLTLAFLMLLGTLYLFKSAEFYSRAWLAIWFFSLAGCLIALRVTTMRRLRKHVAEGVLKKRIAIFGAPDFAKALKTQIEASTSLLDASDVYEAGALSTSEMQSALGGLQELREAIERQEYESVIIAVPAADAAVIQRAVKSLASYSIELLLCTSLEPDPVVDMGSRHFGRLRVSIVNWIPMSERYQLLKSALDCALALIGLIVLAPLFAIVAAAIKLDSPGPVFFRQRRYGQNNRIFRIFKFRTMAVTEDGEVVTQATPQDKRVTRIGRLLRKTSIDELPQLLNVLLGDMSIVGPRPHAVAHDHMFEQWLDLYSRRRRVKPGITGWAQVNGFRGETKSAEEVRTRMEHDLYYIDNWSVWLDIEIMTRTLFVLSRGAY